MKPLNVLTALLVATLACNTTHQQAPVEPQEKPSSVKMSLSMVGAPEEIVRITGSLTKQGYDTLSTDFVIEGDSATAEFQSVPVGRWHLTVQAFDSTNIVRYFGETDVEVLPGVVTPVTLVLNPADGSVLVTVTWGAGTKAGNAMVFDGIDNFVDIANSGSLTNIDSALTIEAWVEPAYSYYNYIVCKGVSQLQYTMELVENSYPAFILEGLDIDYSGAGEYWSRLVIPQRLPEGQWSHLAITYRYDQGINVYINGSLAHHANATGSLSPSQQNLRIGALLNNDYSLFFAGIVDEVRIWNVARSADDIQLNMRKELEGSEYGLVGYWNFNEATGASSLLDKSAQQNHGVIYGNPQFIRSNAF